MKEEEKGKEGERGEERGKRKNIQRNNGYNFSKFSIAINPRSQDFQ